MNDVQRAMQKTTAAAALLSIAESMSIVDRAIGDGEPSADDISSIRNSLTYWRIAIDGIARSMVYDIKRENKCHGQE